MTDKRPIDRVRESALHMSVGDKDEAITGFVKIDRRLHLIKQHSIYEIKLADEIDPERTNINVPNTQQKVLHYGSENEFVGRTLLTANELLKESYLTEEIDTEQLLNLIFGAVKELAHMLDSITALRAELDAANKSVQDNRHSDRSVGLPAMKNLQAKFKDFIQRADDALESLFAVIKNVYKDFQKGGWEEFGELVEQKYGQDDPFSRLLQDNTRFLRFVRRTRNATVHPVKHQRVIVRDFSFGANNTITPPTVEVIVPHTPQPAMLLLDFMTQIFDGIVVTIELVIANICERHIRNIGNLRPHVVERSHRQGEFKHVRFGYDLFKVEAQP
jgi:hypothetical protein